MELRELLSTLRRFKLLTISVFLGVVAFGVSAALTPESRYQASSTLLVTPSSRQIDYAAIDAVRYLLPSIAARLQTQTFRDAVEKSEPTVDWTTVDLSAATEGGTSILRTIGEATDPATAALAANAAAKQVLKTPFSNLVKIQLVDPARAPGAPSSPQRKLIIFASVILGVILAVFAALIANAIMPRVRTASEIRRRYGLEILGEIPNITGLPRKVSEVWRPHSRHERITEAYQRIIANLDVVAGSHTAIGVTSCTAGEGKSTVVANLAWASGVLGRQIVVVDADLRRPVLHTSFDLSAEPGLADMVDGIAVSRLVRPTALASLRVIPAGHARRHPATIISTAFPQVLNRFRDEFLLIDMPPMLGVAEGTLIATQTRAVVLVIDARHGHPEELDQVLHELQRADVEVLGAVLTKASVRRSKRIEAYYSTPVSVLESPPPANAEPDDSNSVRVGERMPSPAQRRRRADVTQSPER